MNPTESFASNIFKTDYSALSAENISRAKIRILDAVGCLMAGSNAAGCQGMLALLKQWGGAPESHVLVHGFQAPAHNAAMLNSLMTRSFDFEPVEAEGENSTGPAHISGTTVPTALTMTEHCSASGKELITALCLGDDLAARLSIVSGFDFALGWDNTGTINKFGAAAIASKLLNLNQNQIYQTLGITLNHLGGSMAGVWDKTMSFKLPIALASRDGIFAAELAQKGFSGVKDPFTGPRGFFDLFSRNPQLVNLTKDLGQRFYADCVIKPYPSCRSNHSAIDSALKIVSEHSFNIADVDQIEVNTTQATLKGFVGQPLILGDTPQIDAAFSLRYSVADALLRKSVQPEHYSLEMIQDPRITALVGRMNLPGNLPAGGLFSSQVTLKMRDGQVYSAGTGVARGDIARNPLSYAEILAKYRHNVAYSNSISEANSEKTRELIENLEDLKDVRELTALLIA